MKKYKVLTPFFKLSDKKNYEKGDDIELSDEQAYALVKEGRIESDTFKDSQDGTKGIVTRKAPEQADKEIKSLNKKRKK